MKIKIAGQERDVPALRLVGDEPLLELLSAADRLLAPWAWAADAAEKEGIDIPDPGSAREDALAPFLPAEARLSSAEQVALFRRIVRATLARGTTPLAEGEAEPGDMNDFWCVLGALWGRLAGGKA